jgi:hypothetical protein
MRPVNLPAPADASTAAAADLRPTDPSLQRFRELLSTSLQHGDGVRLLLARPQAAEPGLQRVVVRPLLLKGQPMLSFVYSHATRDITKNLPVPQGLAAIDALLGGSFRNAHLRTPQAETQLTLSKKGRAQLSVHSLAPTPAGGAPAAPAVAVAPHDRAKQRWLDLARPFLVALGVTTPQHQLVPAMARKWKQINKFVEVFAHALARSPLADAQQLRVVDFGAGKAYLSFAVHDWLRHTQGREAEVTGVELRPDLAAQGQRIVADLGLQGMQVEQGDVRAWKAGPMDVMIALHACDTATDHAIHLGIRAGASIILCSPCCHQQLRPQLLSPGPLRSVFQHGIHAEQQAEMVTDSLRALLLEAQGYDTQVFEFVSLEHTAKNKMILAVKRRSPRPPDEALANVDELKRFFGVQEHCLETLLRAEAPTLR